MRQGNSVVSALRFLLNSALLFGAVLLVLAPREARAQLETASINGTVTDATGSVVPGATVNLRNLATNVEHTTNTNDSGTYVFVNISPGRYTLNVSKQGFATATRPEFELAVNQTTTVDFSLKVGSSAEVVQVEALTTSLQTSSSELGTVIGGRSVDSLPLNGRNFTQLLNLTPGVSTVNVGQSLTNQQFAGNTVGSFSFPSINGQTNRSNLFLLDGLNNQESFASTYSVPPIVDDIQEFKVDSHNDQAQFGGALGGVINVVTKSGTNQIRGELWEFFRNSALDARDPISKTNRLQQNQFGANVGGPVILPHYNGRNRTFFFGSYEGVRIHQGNTSLFTIPDPAQLTGDFSGLGAPLYNPYSTATGGIGARSRFRCNASGAPLPLLPGTKLQDQTTGTPCNILPPALVDPRMLAVAQMLYGPLKPNVPGAGSSNNYNAPLVNTQSPDSYSVRVDEQLGQKDAFWFRFSHNNSPRNVPGIFGQSNMNEYTAHQWGVTWSHTFSSSSILSAQFGRNYGFSTNPTLLPEDVSNKLIQAGGYAQSFACSFKRGPRSCYFNAVDFSNVISSFTEGSAPAVVADVWQWKANYTKIFGKHTFSTGVDFNTNGFQQTFNTGHLDFSNAQTASAVSGATGGYGLASFLLGIPASVTYRNVFESEHGGWVDGFYAQDQWKVTDRLTVNIGARYDVTFIPVYGSDSDGNNRIGNWNDNNGTYVLQKSAPDCASTGNVPPCIPGGTLPANVVVSPDGRLWHNSYDNIQPRLGLAYRLTNRTVIRTSFGRFFDNWAAVIQMSQNQQGTWPSTGQFIVNFNNVAAPPTVFAQDPLQGANTTPSPTPFTQNNWFVDPNLKNPYSYQWNFGVQEGLTPSTTLTVNYVGSTNHRTPVGITGNQALTPGPGNIPSPTCNTTACVGTRFRYPYQVPTHYDKSVGKAWYHAMQISLDKKASHGLSYLLSYTWSKTLSIGSDEWFSAGTNGTSIQDPYHLENDKGLAGFDLPHIFTASWVYELPFGAGRRFRTGIRPMDETIGGWQINGIANLSGGTLFNVVASNGIPNVGQSSTGAQSERVNLVGDPRLGNPTTGEWFNVSAFAVPAQFTFGNFGRNVLRSDGRANFDLSIFRSFHITEAKRFEFRAEAFNLTNSPIWGTPGNNISTNLKCAAATTTVAPCPSGQAPNSAAFSGVLVNPNGPFTNTFGVVTSTARGYSPRQLQFALKFYY